MQKGLRKTVSEQYYMFKDDHLGPNMSKTDKLLVLVDCNASNLDAAAKKLKILKRVCLKHSLIWQHRRFEQSAKSQDENPKVSVPNSVSDQMRKVTPSPSVPELQLCIMAKKWFAEYYAAPVKLTFDPLDMKYYHFIILSY